MKRSKNRSAAWRAVAECLRKIAETAPLAVLAADHLRWRAFGDAPYPVPGVRRLTGPSTTGLGPLELSYYETEITLAAEIMAHALLAGSFDARALAGVGCTGVSLPVQGLVYAWTPAAWLAAEAQRLALKKAKEKEKNK